ncbi:MAG TPA: hypothetical protein VFU47_07135, partial [Armatimonadota bacterium]|nr:hypothetical protein [Armatimonadota bacterium]
MATVEEHVGEKRDESHAEAPGTGRKKPTQEVPGFLESATTAWPGKPYPLGATWDGKGTNFAIYSELAYEV